MTNNDPRAFDAHDEWIECPKCRNVTVALANYEISDAAEGATLNAEPLEFLLFGWVAFLANYVTELFSLGGRKSKLARLKAQILPRFPRALVCPRCLHVIERI